LSSVTSISISRANIAGIDRGNVDTVADAIAAVLK
jgi:aspartate/tyrosine/aromatic aminotransferase